MSILTVADLFAGVGGVALGFKRSGFKVDWANELDPNACKTYRANFDHNLIEGDIHKLIDGELEVATAEGTKLICPADLPRVDVLCGGFPCQAFSIAGYQKGFSDDRGNLFFEILKLARIVQPRVLFLENVKNLQGHDKGNTFRVIMESLEKEGYFAKHKVLNTCEYSDVPQNRERIYIVAFRCQKAYSRFEFPKKIEDRKAVSELLDDNVDDRYYYSKSKYYEQLKREMVNSSSIYQWRRVYVRENKSGVCPTLTANMGTGGHNVPLVIDKRDIRKLTPRECFRFQGFPDSFTLPDSVSQSALYKQAGNSVSVPVISSIANNIRLSLQGEQMSMNSQVSLSLEPA